MTARFSLLGKFSGFSLLAIVVLALVIGSALHRRIEARALRNAEQLVHVVADAAIAPRLSQEELGGALSAERLDALDAAIARVSGAGARIKKANVFALDGRTVYSRDRATIGEREADDGFQIARTGRFDSDVERSLDDRGQRVDPTLEVYAPLRLRGGGDAIDGVAEIYLDYAPTAAAIHADTRTLYEVLLGCMGMLYLALFVMVRRISRRLTHQAQHDILTGLPNRTTLYDRAARVIGAVKTFGGLAGLLLIDLDRFKEVNDTLGHDHGDALLCDVAERLGGALRRGDTLARLGGDEFGVLLHDLPDRAAAAELASRLLDALERPFVVRGVPVQLGASIGVVMCPDHGMDVTTLMRRADVAMYEAKREQARIRVYDAKRDPYSPARLQLVSELRGAIVAGELVLHYQPKVAVAGGEVTGVEALIRWQHPKHGLLGPGDFLPLAERTGMMGELTRWVIDSALGQVSTWRHVGLDVQMAVNLAAANILDAGLPDAVAERLAHWCVPGERLTCELSESTVMADPRRAGEVLERLRALGVRLSLDDFGTGHSSLAYLKRLPLDEVKIDREFVSGMANDEHDALIVRSTIDLASNLGLEVVAEGVESEDVLDHLRRLNCHEAQGFHLSRPLPPDALVDWLLARRAGQPV